MTVTVPVTPTITWQPSGNHLWDGLKRTQLNASTTVAGTFAYSPALGTVLGAGPHSLTAIFTPTDMIHYTVATANVTLTVNKAAPAAGLTASPNPVLVQNAVALTATVSSSASTGSVTFSDSNTTLGTANLSSGTATLSTSTLTVGAHSITALYGGDGNFTSVSSTAVGETVEDFTVTIGGSGSSQTVQPGGTATYTLPMSPSGGTTFPSAVTLAATGLPTGFTSSFSPSSLPAGSSATNVALTIQVPLTAMLERSRQPGRGLPLVALSLLMLPLAGGIKRSSKWFRRLALIAVLLTAVGGLASLTGCGGGGSGGSGGGGGGSQVQAYNISVTATSGALAHSTTVTLTVQ